MAQARWHFREFKPGDNVSDPDFARALFSRDDATSIKSVVRESVQNSLDARRPDGPGVSVRFAIRTGSHAADAKRCSVFFDGLWEHITSADSGTDDPPTLAEPVPYLVVEDFGTHGLIGNPEAWDPFHAGKNSFFLFFRALGRSGKEGEDRGRWGVGKFVFPMTSRAHSLLAVTVREDDPQALAMGRAVLKTHRVGNFSYHPDGHWGTRHESGLVLPIVDDGTVTALQEVFNLQRSNEPGLSVIVPWIPADVTGKALLAAVAGEYFLPILRSELIIELDHNGAKDTIDASRLLAIAGSLEPHLVRARVELGVEAATWPVNDLIRVGRDETADFDWTGHRLTEQQRSVAATCLEEGRVVGLRVPTRVRRKEGPDLETHFDVYLQQVPGLGRARPLIIREGITIAEDKSSYLQDCVALIVVDHPPLATFVGDAETPAHNELQYDLVKAKYTLAGKLIGFLRGAAAAIVRELEGADQSADHTLLAEFFPRPSPSVRPNKPKPKESPTGGEAEEVPKIPTRVARYRIRQVDAGFVVAGTDALNVGSRITVLCAYEIRRGNPLRKYRDMDFDLEQDLVVQQTGLAILSANRNRLEAEVEDPKFTLSVSGFDGNRNLFVQVRVDDPEVGNDDSSS
jgi:hypothetical protein